MSRTLYLDCIGGIAGDMLLAALLDVGASEDTLRDLPARLGIGEVGIEVERVERHGIGAVHVRVVPSSNPPHRTWRALRTTMENADLPDRARTRALAALDRLAAAEAKIHGTPVEDVHFHELGGEDTLVDLCGGTLLVDEL